MSAEYTLSSNLLDFHTDRTIPSTVPSSVEKSETAVKASNFAQPNIHEQQTSVQGLVFKENSGVLDKPGSYTVSSGSVARTDDDKKNLQNVVTTALKNDDGKTTRMTIRHGKIHTEEAKEQFKATILHLKNSGQLVQQKNGRYRITSTSLLASLNWVLWQNETKWVEFQHQAIEELKDELAEEGIDLVHLHYQIHNSSNYETLVGEDLSPKINAQGLVDYIDYFAEEVSAGLSEKDSNDLKALLGELKQSLYGSTVGSFLRSTIIGRLLAWIYNKFIRTPTSAELKLEEFQKSANPKVKAMAHALHNLISGNRERGSVSRHQEILSLAVLDHALGINSAMNCKSGVDRTGLVHATELAVSQMIEKDGWDSVLNLVSNFDQYASSLDAKVQNMTAEEYKTAIGPEGSLSVEEKQVALFRGLVYQNLNEIGKPVVKAYTDVEGFKFGNHLPILYHPLVAMFMPKFVTVSTTEGGEKQLQLTGNGGIFEGSSGLTTEGRAHLLGDSRKRSS